MHQHKVETAGSVHYPLIVGNELDDYLTKTVSEMDHRRLFLVIDERVDELHGERLYETLSRNCKHLFRYIVPRGEASKSITQWKNILDYFLNNNIDRHTPILAVGGGVTGDLAGFTAATVLRGVPLIHIPTTLLAMVDSSIGGKTGINHETGKNLIGSFYQPHSVIMDMQYLATLEEKEWVNGLSEILKYASIEDQTIFSEVEEAIQNAGFQPGAQWKSIVSKCAAIKGEIVQQDEKEKGKRAILNFGHTFAHAIEAEAGYGQISHGEAVYAGMLAALYASSQLGADVSPDRLLKFRNLYHIAWNERSRDVAALTKRMKFDKKVKENTIRLILLNKWEEPYLYECRNDRLITEAWKYIFEQAEL